MDDLLSLLTSEQRAAFVDNLGVVSYKKNDIIYHEGDAPTQLFCLLKGKVKIYQEGAGGRNQIIRVVRPISYFGYRAHFAGENHLSTGAAFEQSTVATIPMALIDDTLKSNYALSQHFMQNLAVLLGVSDRRTVNLTQKHIRSRLAEALLFLKDSYGLEKDNSTLSMFLSREDLANLSNMTTSNAIRTLSQFSAEHLIAVDGRKIKFIDEERLRELSEMGE